MKYKKLSQYAKDNDLTYQTAYNHYKKKLISNVKKLPSGTILVGEERADGYSNKNVVAIYSRVSSNSMKKNLYRQEQRLTEYATKNGYTIKYSIREISSGMNDSRKKLQSLLLKNDYDILLVEHKDRLTRFGFNYLDILLGKDNKRIEVVNLASNDNENLMEDLISIIYSFSARMYGQRRSKNKISAVITELGEIK